MLFDVVTLFPALFDSFLRESLIGKALEKRIFDIRVTDIRDFTEDKHRTADDRPFGGGPGMVLKPEPVAGAIGHCKSTVSDEAKTRVILLSPAGRTLSQALVESYASLDHLILVCGRYEGIDQRVSEALVDDEISVGDYVLSGGEIPAMVLIEAVGRLLPGTLGKFESTEEETFSSGLLEYPHYTRPRDFRGLTVPDVLLSGDHEAIRRWRRLESLRRTLLRRPEMLSRASLTAEDLQILEQVRAEAEAEALSEKMLDFSGLDD